MQGMTASSVHKTERPIHVVVIGASAGSLEPLRRLIARVERDHVSYIVLTHLPPDWDSQLAPLLQKYSVLPICKVIEPITLHANHIYVGGEGVDLFIKDGKLCTAKAQRTGPRRNIDRLMISLAEVWSSHAIGIILSGSGYDGTAGLAAIRKAGGVTMVQTPESAQVDTMPKSARRFAEYCSSPERLGDRLMQIIDEGLFPAS